MCNGACLLFVRFSVFGWLDRHFDGLGRFGVLRRRFGAFFAVFVGVRLRVAGILGALDIALVLRMAIAARMPITTGSISIDHAIATTPLLLGGGGEP